MLATLNLEQRRNEIHAAHDTAIERLIEVGRLLVDTQNQLTEQSFIQFCDTLKFSRQTAYNYMRLFSHSLVQRLDTLQDAMINLSVWYYVPPQDTETVTKIAELASKGKKVTKELALDLIKEVAPLNEGLKRAAETSPQETVDMVFRGTVLDSDGHDKPLIDADPTLIQVNAIEHEYERLQRQKAHIQETAKKQVKLECELELITDKDGVVWMALPQNTSLKLIKQTITIYYNDSGELESETKGQAAA